MRSLGLQLYNVRKQENIGEYLHFILTSNLKPLISRMGGRARGARRQGPAPTKVGFRSDSGHLIYLCWHLVGDGWG